jgi:nicotianamine synthase
MELGAIYASTSQLSFQPRKIAFIGSGPLPLSSLCLLHSLSSLRSPFASLSLSRKEPIEILNIDRSKSAIELSSTICQALGPRGKGMKFSHAEVGDGRGGRWLEEYDVVFLAALVGESQVEKELVVKEVAEKMRSGAVLVVRSAERQRILLYPVSWASRK